MENKFILQPDPARVMEGLRDTGYSFDTAMADLIDNSIAANATLIKIYIAKDATDQTPVVYIADNGCGMNLEGLQNAMRYGSNRRADAGSLGKFGLGLKTASTAFCRRLSLVSRGDDKVVRKVTWDLDHICQVNAWELLQSQPSADDLDMLEDAANGDTGTVVIWENVDRLMKTYRSQGASDNALTRIVEKLKFHVSMTFQRYIDSHFDTNTVAIYINNERVPAWDPFCQEYACTKLLQSVDVPVELEYKGTKTSFKLEAYLLPRVDDFPSKKAKLDAHINNDMQGFYVYRENRLIFHGSWLGICTNDPHISLLRINLSFDHTMDDNFDVDIKKSRINLSEEIFDYLSEFIKAPRREAENLYRVGRTQANTAAGASAHDASNNMIEGKAPSLENSKVEVVDATKNEVTITNQYGANSVGTIKISAPTQSGNKRVIPVNSINDGLLWEPALVDGCHAVNINQSHDYYTKVYAPNLDNQTLITGMDSLLWALAEAEVSTYNEEVRDQYEDMRITVSRILKKLVKELPDPEATEE